MAVTQRPLALAAFEAPATRAAWKSIESWVLPARQDLAVPAELPRWMAERANARPVEIDASHAVTVSQPGAVTDVILEAAETTGRWCDSRRCDADRRIGDHCWPGPMPSYWRIKLVMKARTAPTSTAPYCTSAAVLNGRFGVDDTWL